MNSDDLVQIWLHTFPQLEELEAYEVASSHRPTPHNRGVAQLQVNKSTAAAASTMAAAATPGSNPFNNPPQQSRRKPSSSGLALPGQEQYAALIKLRQQRVLLVDVDEKLAKFAGPRDASGALLPANFVWDGASGAGGASGSGGAGEENEVSSTADDAARETAPETEAQGEVESEAARETAGEAGEMAREAAGEMAGEAAGAAAGEAEGEEETGHGAAEDGDDGEAARVPCAEESALHTERAQLHLNIGRLEESLKAFDVPAVNDAVLKDSNDIEYFDEIVGVLEEIGCGTQIAALVSLFGSKPIDGVTALEERIIEPAVAALAKHSTEALRDLPEALVQLVLWHRFAGARDFLAAMTNLLKCNSSWAEEKTALHQRYAGELALAREFNSVVETCHFSSDGTRIMCAKGVHCVRARRLKRSDGYSLGMPSRQGADSSYSLRNWRKKDTGGCTHECFPFLAPDYDPSAPPPAAAGSSSGADPRQVAAMENFASSGSGSAAPLAAAALAISEGQTQFEAELKKLQGLDSRGLADRFEQMYSADGPTYGSVSKPILNASISAIDELARKLGCAKDVTPAGSCQTHPDSDCPADCRVRVLKDWRTKIMAAMQAPREKKRKNKRR